MRIINSTCLECGTDFVYQRLAAQGDRRVYCDECVAKRKDAAARGNVRQLLIDVKATLVRVNATLDRIEMRNAR